MAVLLLHQLAERIDAELVGDGSASVRGCAPIQSAGPAEVAFLANLKYARFLDTTQAAAVIVGRDARCPENLTRLVAKDPYFAFRQAMIELHGFRRHPGVMDAPENGISSRAAVHPEAVIDPSAVVHPFVTVEAGARIGPGTVLYPGVYVGRDTSIGRDSVLYPGVVVYERCVIGDRVHLHGNTVVGQDGFGYATHDGQHHKIPQQGIVVIEDDVELGAACAIERAAMGETRIGRGTKFADVISIGHGTTIGAHCLLVSLVGVSGSVELGDYVVLGGQVGVAGHIALGDGVQAAAKSGIMHDIPAGTKVGGQPAIEFRQAKKNAIVASDLAGLAQRVRQLERRLEQLTPEGENAGT